MPDYAFSGTQVLLGGGLLWLLLTGIIFSGQRYFRRLGWRPSAADLRTKYAAVDVFGYRTTFLRLGLVCALAFTFLAFNWTQYDVRQQSGAIAFEVLDEIIETTPPITYPDPPPPPPPPPPIIEAMDQDLLLDTTTFRSMDISAHDQLTPPPALAVAREPVRIPPPPPMDQGHDKPLLFVERMPIFGDCQAEADYEARKQCSDRAMLQYINQLVRYPVIAQENRVQGTAVVRFVIEKDGTLSQITLVRDPGSGLGKEAERVVQVLAREGPRWTPGKQNGQPVRVQFNLPVRFKLE